MLSSDDPFKLLLLLQARSYKKELILFMVDESSMWDGFNFIFNQKDLGYNHYVILSTREYCKKLMAAFPDGGAKTPPLMMLGGRGFEPVHYNGTRV
jgi:hypothetical protein